MIGQTVSHYKITAKLGEGGMGVVYLAQDTQLGREVAIKVLPEAVARDPERLARFEREARLLAALDHPNIAAIYSFERVDVGEGLAPSREGTSPSPTCFLVMQLAEGDTLAERIARGPIPIEKTAPMVRQIADALETAHDKGIVHRDLKPANIKVDSQGNVKVLDFGLAKALAPDPASGNHSDLSLSPTLTAQMTGAGVLLGTAGYMSPEQAKGQEIDKRADIWAFGCVLYEMLTGQAAFVGDSMSESLAAILKEEIDPGTLPAATPESIRWLLDRCLEKDPRRRLRDIGEARIRLEDTESAPAKSAPRAAERVEGEPARGAKTWIPWVLVAALATTVLAILSLLTRSGVESVSTPAARFNVQLSTQDPLPEDGGSAMVASPDGRLIAFVAGFGQSTQLYLRSLDDLDARPLSGTEGARSAFFSPDGQWIAFFSKGRLKKINITGGAPVTLTETASNSRGGTWTTNDMLVFTPNINHGLVGVPAEGGEPSTLTTLDPSADERSHRWPHAIPDSDWVLFLAQLHSGNYEDGNITAVNILSGERRIIYRGGSFPIYSPSGHLLFARTGQLLAASFNRERMEITGDPQPVVQNLMTQTGDQEIGDGSAQFSLSASGLLAYRQGQASAAKSAMVLVDRAGRVETLLSNLSDSANPKFSPDGSRIVWIQDASPGNDLFVFEIATRLVTRLSTGSSARQLPHWTPDGLYITFGWAVDGRSPDIYQVRADGVGGEELLHSDELTLWPGDWSPDGRTLLFHRLDAADTLWDLWTLTLAEQPGGQPVVKELLKTAHYELGGDFSPDGRWVAYHSDESGENRVYVMDAQNPSQLWRISEGPGNYPRWSADGTQLFFVSGNRIMAAQVSSGGEIFQAGRAEELFSGNFLLFSGISGFDVSPDAQSFVLFQRQGEIAETELTHAVIQFNAFDELERVAPTQR